MSKLEDLYEGKKRLERAGYKLTAEMLQDMDQLEEQLIIDEILPTLSKDLEPSLAKIQRELVLVVEYKPGEPIRVALSRKTNIAEMIEAKRLEIDPQVEHKEYGKHVGGKHNAPKTGIRVTRRDGSVLQEKTAALTFATAIKEAGLLTVRQLGYKSRKVPLVSTTLDEKYGSRQLEMEPGLFVITHSNTKEKKKWLDKISDALGLGWTVKIID